jgi:2-polyprenyl-3-methyl-5-hydroxy-6-metoxy-1,4-benzoquinol methylase
MQQQKPDLISRNCPICNSHDASNIYAAANIDESKLDSFAFASRKIPEYMHHRLIRCSACELVYASPVPSSVHLGENYEEADYDSSSESKYASKTYSSFLPKIKRRLPDLHGALDIGTGDGSFLKELIDYEFTEVVGVEPSKAPIKAATAEIRPLIREKLFDPAEFNANSLSLVTCFQTIEHVSNPLELCTSVYDILKEKGAFFFICHNYEALSTKILGRKSPIFDIEHLQLFSPKSAKEILLKSGFVDIEIRTVHNKYPFYYWVKLLPLLKPQTKRKLIPLLKKNILGRTPIYMPTGNIAVIGYKNKR